MANNDAEGVATPFDGLPADLQPSALTDLTVGTQQQQHGGKSAAPPKQQPLPHQQDNTSTSATAGTTTAPSKKRRGGRQRDPVWNDTTIVNGKDVVCNKCHSVIHRLGCAKVERVRAHFENKCVFTKRQKMGGTGGDAETDTLQRERSQFRADYTHKMGLFKRRIAQWIYSSGHSFSEVKNDCLRTALRLIRPDVMLPTQYELEVDLLEIEHDSSLTKVYRSLSGKPCCLVLEDWVDTNGQRMTNVAAFAESNVYFLEMVALESEDEECITRGIERALSQQAKATAYGVLSPLATSVSKPNRARIQETHTQCVFYYGCVAYALRLLMVDMCTILPWLGAIQDSVLQLIKTIDLSAPLKHRLRRLQHAESKPPLVMPDPAAGATIYDALDSVLKSERELVALVSSQDFSGTANTSEESEALKRMQSFVLGDTFMQDVLNALNILHPLQQQLTQVKTERIPISYVHHCFLALLGFYEQMELVERKDKALIASAVNERFNSIYGEVHGIAYLLDPVYLGLKMDETKRHQAEAFLARCCTDVLQVTGVNILLQLQKYRGMVKELQECNPSYWDLLVSGKVPPFEFWVERRQFPQLQQIAWIVFALPVVGTTTSQSLGSSCALLHAKLCNQLPPEKLQKVMHIYCNAKYQQPEFKEPDSLLSLVLGDGTDPTQTVV